MGMIFLITLNVLCFGIVLRFLWDIKVMLDKILEKIG